MKITVRAAFAACAISAALVGGVAPAVVAAPAVAGPCLFGHVDPNDDNSACRGSDSAKWPESESTPDGTPALSCTRLNDNQHVRTRDPHGWRYWLCKGYKDQWGNKYYDWTEVLGS
ncbi:hypothetical protein [Nocardia sp. NPDC057440]|uniref:hypothetical protein n=1 Tax=Nocardia sp. NPDC057440 TaxID=3346134 RepID=UPI0036718439